MSGPPVSLDAFGGGGGALDLLAFASTPTAYGLMIQPLTLDNETINPDFGNVLLFPLYGNWDVLAFLGPVIWSPWFRVLATMEGRGRPGEINLNARTSTGLNPLTDEFVALPDSYTVFEGNCVRVLNPQTHESAVVPVGDVGPYNGGGTRSNPTAFNDPYWSPGPGGLGGGSGFQPPETSSGTSLRGRSVGRFAYGAGIDISYALQQRLGFNGNADVAWRFEACPAQ